MSHNGYTHIVSPVRLVQHSAPTAPAILFNKLHESSCLLPINLAPILILAAILYMCASVCMRRSRRRIRTCRSQEPMVDPRLPD
jgi:hypothetical protein